MLSSVCSRCFSELRSPSQRGIFQLQNLSTSFHSSAIHHAQPVKKKRPNGSPTGPRYRESRSAQVKRGRKIRERPRPPAVGERKALRKRIVVSNTNALEVSGMRNLSSTTMADEQLRGEVLGIPGPMIDELRAVEAFKTTQGWNLFKKPGFLVRKETVELGRYFQYRNEDGKSSTEVVRKIITGEQGTGKSLHLMQAMSLAFLKNWIVITVPETQDWVNNQSSYAPLAGTSPQQYIQPDLTASLLTRLQRSNNPYLKKATVSLTHSDFPMTLRSNTTLQSLAEFGATDPAMAHQAWKALWRELTAPNLSTGQKPPPILITIDGLAHWMQDSKYRSAEYEPIHPYNLTMVRQFLDLLFNQPNTITLPNGGMILAATSGSNNPAAYSLEIALRRLAARNAGISPSSHPDLPLPEPYRKVDDVVMKLFQGSGVEIQELKGITKDEARGLLEYFAKSGVLREKVSDSLVAEKWSLAAGGVIGQVVKLGKRIRLR